MDGATELIAYVVMYEENDVKGILLIDAGSTRAIL